MHQSFGNVGDLDGKTLGTSETLVSEVYAVCSELGRVHTSLWRLEYIVTHDYKSKAREKE